MNRATLEDTYLSMVARRELSSRPGDAPGTDMLEVTP